MSSLRNRLFSYSCALCRTTANTQRLSFQSLPHSFCRDGVCPHSSHSGTHPPPSIQLSFQQLTQYPFCKSFCLIYIHLMGGVYPPCWPCCPSFERFSSFQFRVSSFQFLLQNPLNVRRVDFHSRRPRNQVQRKHHAKGVLLPDKASFHPRERPALDAYPGSNAQIRMRFDPRSVQNSLPKTFDFPLRQWIRL